MVYLRERPVTDAGSPLGQSLFSPLRNRIHRPELCGSARGQLDPQTADKESNQRGCQVHFARIQLKARSYQNASAMLASVSELLNCRLCQARHLSVRR